MTSVHNTWTPRRAARIAGAAYLITSATAIFGTFFVPSRLIIAGDGARTASNIVAHSQLFRVGIVSDLLTGVGVVFLNWALYELLAPTRRSLARLAALFRLVEVSVGSAIAVSSFIVLSILTGTDSIHAFEPIERQALARVFREAYLSGYLIVLLFFGFGSTIYMYLMIRSRYIPRPLALLALAGSALVPVYALARMLFPAAVTAAFAAVRTLPTVALVALGIIAVPIIAFEIQLGFWLLLKGARVREQT